MVLLESIQIFPRSVNLGPYIFSYLKGDWRILGGEKKFRQFFLRRKCLWVVRNFVWNKKTILHRKVELSLSHQFVATPMLTSTDDKIGERVWNINIATDQQLAKSSKDLLNLVD